MVASRARTCLLWFILWLALTDTCRSEPSPEEIREAARHGGLQVDELLHLEERLISRGIHKAPRNRAPASARQSALRALKITEASKKLAHSLNWSAEETRLGLSGVSLVGTQLEEACQEAVDCSSVTDAKYRSADGSCNNLDRTSWGQQVTPFQRIQPPDYGNGVDSPRLATDGSELENARVLSNTVVSIYGRNDPTNITLAVMTWGQFITHDMALAADYTLENGDSPLCCTSDGQMLAPEDLHPQCLPIQVPTGDILNMFSANCLSFTRSQVGTDQSCTMNHAQQLNSNTHWLDGSQVYGSDESTTRQLRSFVDGLLLTSDSDGRPLLPIRAGCTGHQFAVCFQAGDTRVEENPQLAIMHTLFMRQHNRVAGELKRINPSWEDETLFQEARRIVVAQIQHITYNEYLPILIGSKAIRDFGLQVPATGYYGSYDPTVNPAISNEFTAAAFRVTHSSIQGYLELFDASDEEETDKSFSLSRYFFDASRLQSAGFIDSALRGLTKQPPQYIDTFYSNEVTDRLYIEGKRYGSDLVAITIQRGREHGIGGYNVYRQLCGLPRAEAFDDLSREMDPFNVESLRSNYKSVDDIDLYIGCLAEDPMPLGDPHVGPTAACIIGDQFSKLKDGDRFFYGHQGQAGSFSPKQMDQIHKSSLARLMCDNSDGSLATMQPQALRSPIGTNERVPCDSLPSVDLKAWKA